MNRFAAARLFVAFSVACRTACHLFAQSTPPTNSLQLWVKADAGVTTNATGLVEKWADQSGNGNDALQADDTAKPTLVGAALNGKPVVRFDGAKDYLNVADSAGLEITGDIASFAVIRVDDYTTFNSIWGKTAGGGGNIPAPNDWYLSSGSGIPQLFRGDGSAFQNVAGQRPIRANTYAVIGIRQVGTTMTHYLNGSTNGVGEITVTPGDGGTDLKIGSRNDLFTKMKGDIAELLIYGDSLSDSDVNNAVNYLRNKYGITNTPPTVSISAPVNNATVAAPAKVNVTVAASDPDGVVTKVKLLANGSTVGTATVAPYTFPVTIDTAGTVTFTAVATDDRDATTTSTNVSITVTAASAPTLNASSHLKVWLRGDAGTTVGPSGGITTWADQSGSKNDAVQADETQAPTVSSVSGKPALHFDGSTSFMDIADNDSVRITGDLATFFVVRFDDFAGYRAVWAKTSGSQPRPTDYYVAQGSGVPAYLRGYTTNDTENVNQGVGAAGSVPAGTPIILGVQQAGTNVTHYLNGAPNGTGVITLTPQDMNTNLKIGTRDDFFTRMKGDIAEILIYDAALSDSDLSNVRQYLAAKYNIPSVQLSNNAPTVKISAPANGSNVAAGGAISITATATDADGSVARVDFYANGLAIGSDATSPFSVQYSPKFSGPVTVTAIATDNLGATTTSAPITFTVTGGETAPIPTIALALWLRADSGVTTNASGAVIQWQDASGNKNTAIQTDSTKAPALSPASLNNLPTLTFDGVDDYLEVASSPTVAITGDISTFFVINVADYDTYRAVWAKTAGNLPAANDYYLLPNTGEPRYYHGDPSGNFAQFTGASPIPSGSFVTAGYELAGSTATHYLSGAENGSGGLAAAGADTGAPLRIGTRGDFVTRFKGGMAELVIYARALSDAERAQVESYFEAKYFQAPSSQPSLKVSQGSNNALVFSWDAAITGFALESSGKLGTGANWQAVPQPVVPANGQNTVTVQATGGAQFYRLKK